MHYKATDLRRNLEKCFITVVRKGKLVQVFTTHKKEGEHNTEDGELDGTRYGSAMSMSSETRMVTGDQLAEQRVHGKGGDKR